MKKKFINTMLLLFLITPILSCTTGMEEYSAGREYDRQQDYRNAAKKYSEAIKRYPDHWELYVYRSVAYEKINKIDLAIIDMSTSLKLIPKKEKWYQKVSRERWALNYIRRGTLYHKKNSYVLAINDYDKALELKPHFAAYFYRAVTKEKMNKIPAAIEDYSKVVNIMSKFLSGVSDSDKIRVYLNRANLYRKQNKLNLALADNNQAIKIDGSWKAFLERGVTQLKIGNFEKAISDFDKSIKINPSDKIAYLYRSNTRLITSCDLKKVLEDYYSVIDIKNIDDDTIQLAYNEIAWILATATNDNIRDEKKALIYAKKSVEIKADCKNLDTLAVAFAACGRFEDAINTHKRAINFCKSTNPELLSEVQKHLKNYRLKKALREECPGARITMDQLREWQNELHSQ